MKLSESYNGFSGVDITALISGTIKVYAHIQAIYYGFTREMSPIYTLPTLYEKSARERGHHIYGTLIFNKFYCPEPIKTFDIQLLRRNERGVASSLELFDVEIIGASPNKMYKVDTQYIFKAKSLLPWRDCYTGVLKEDG